MRSKAPAHLLVFAKFSSISATFVHLWEFLNTYQRSLVQTLFFYFIFVQYLFLSFYGIMSKKDDKRIYFCF